MSMTRSLVIDNLHVAYGKADVLCGVSMEIAPSRITCLLGANGAGKSTLIRTLLGLTPAREGSIVFEGQDILGLPPTGWWILASAAFPKADGSFRA